MGVPGRGANEGIQMHRWIKGIEESRPVNLDRGLKLIQINRSGTFTPTVAGGLCGDQRL